MPFFNECGHKIDNILDILRGFEPNVGIVHAEFFHYFIDIFDHFRGVLVGGNTRFVGFGDNFIVYVRIVPRVRYVVPRFFEIFPHYIVNECLISVTDMRFPRNGDSASVHLDFAFFQRDKFFLSLGKRIINFHCPFLLFLSF